jgi:NAD(P)-dependent dehydrogenase (short-subunit alcohol dehydrogenase family)
MSSSPQPTALPRRMPMTPSDGVAWITGASSGIGRATALELARRGWTVCASARRQEELEALATEAAAMPGRIVGHAVDVTNQTAMAEVIEAIERVHGPIALAFFNAGIAPYTRGFDLDIAAFRQSWDVNLMGAVNGLSPLLRRMRQRGKGQVAVNASVAGYRGLPRAAAYGASKAAAIHLCEALKFDCDQIGVTMQLVNPGFIDTPLTRKNDFPMPFLMSMEEAARRVVDGFGTTRFELIFPRRLAFLLKLARMLPYGLYFALVARGTGWNKPLPPEA